MKHMVNNRMFSKPLSLNAIGAAAGLSAPRSMLALRGKTIYDSAGTATVIPTTGTVSLFSFENKTFTNPINPIIFDLVTGAGAVSEAGKKFSYYNGTGANSVVRLNNGNGRPFYININFTAAYNSSYVSLFNNQPFNIIRKTTPFYSETWPKTVSYYFTSGYTINFFTTNKYITLESPQTIELTITTTPTYSSIVNFFY